MQTSCFLVIQYPNFLISINGGGGSDFLSSQIIANSEQISSFFNFFFRMRVSGSCHTYIFVSSKSGITLLLLN